jgi:hypothetical protein
MLLNISYDLEYLQIGVEEIEDYLLSEELFWPVTGRPSGGRSFFLKMTIGNLLLSEHRLATLSAGKRLSPSEESEFSRLQRGFETVRSKWRVAWQSKASQEYQTRLKQWMRTLEELKSDRYQNAPYYRNEVRVRVLLELLADQVSQKDRVNLQVFDTALKKILKAGEFVWQEELAPGFPEDQYWYLYGNV